MDQYQDSSIDSDYNFNNGTDMYNIFGNIFYEEQNFKTTNLTAIQDSLHSDRTQVKEHYSQQKRKSVVGSKGIQAKFVTSSTYNVPYILNGELYRIESINGESITVKCLYCPPNRVYRGSIRSTGNFHMHIKRRHPHLVNKLHQMKIHSIMKRTHRSNSNQIPNAKKTFSTDAITSTQDNVKNEADFYAPHQIKEELNGLRSGTNPHDNGPALNRSALEEPSPLSYTVQEFNCDDVIEDMLNTSTSSLITALLSFF